ncbi:beta-2 adrenergic receptor-like [Anneissia japonica]|uniref:beta-2 adrenergic receptor-like n=1 Tax=Anneissia japonica TaxID=1529436 RepID=UPI001425A95C|nr:beta-2 adrenergic receptor-like [Anneissia japonica]
MEEYAITGVLSFKVNETMDADTENNVYQENLYDAPWSNLSLDSKPDDDDSLIRIYLSVLFSFITVGSILGNAVLISVVVVTKHLHNHQNILVANLSTADMIVSSMVMPFSIQYFVTGVWKWGSFFCEVWILFDVLACTASILTLCTIAGDRFVSISKPFYYVSKISKHLIFKFIFFIWLISLCLASIPIALKIDRPQNFTRPERTCDQIFNPIFSIVSSICSFYLPLIVMCTLYFKLYREAKLQSKRINATVVTADDHCPSGCPNQVKRRENKAAVTIGIIVGCFVVCWTPYFIVNIISRLPGVYISPDAYMGFTWLGYFNSAINPYLYVAFTNDIKRTIVKYFTPEEKRRKAIALRNM